MKKKEDLITKGRQLIEKMLHDRKFYRHATGDMEISFSYPKAGTIPGESEKERAENITAISAFLSSLSITIGEGMDCKFSLGVRSHLPILDMKEEAYKKMQKAVGQHLQPERE